MSCHTELFGNGGKTEHSSEVLLQLGVTQLPEDRSRRFVRNVAWNWLSSGIALITGIFLSPFLIHKLGPEGYGVWTLSFALVEYYWLLDLGFRSAVVKFVAHYAATDDQAGINRVVNTALAYGLGMAAVIMSLVMSAGRYAERWFQISPAYRESFLVLVGLITLSWCLGAVFSIFSGAVEAAQQFDMTNRVAIVTTTVRTASTFTLLAMDYGLIHIAIATIASQIIGYVLNYFQFRTVFPAVRLSWRLAKFSMLREMAQFGIHSFTANIATQLVNQGPPVIIGHFNPAAYVGFYSLPLRLLQYGFDFVGRIGLVTNAAAADFTARKDGERLRKLAIYPNRYSLVMFMPLAILLWTHGDQILTRWVGENFATHSAPVLPILLLGYVLAIVGQFSSGMLLTGAGKHRRYARGLLAEAVVVILALWFVVPRYGIIGAAWVATAAMIANRGIFAPWLVCREIGIPWLNYMRQIFIGPLVAAIPPFAASTLLARTLLPDGTWPQLAVHGILIAILYAVGAWMLCVEQEHKKLLQSWILQRLNRRISRMFSPVT
jgi:O-antigen/teichoic acid export membrane protein